MAKFSNFESALAGRLGGKVYTGTTDNTSLQVGEIVAVEDSTFSNLEGNGWTGDFASKTLKQGAVIKGYFTRIKLASGSVIGYKAE